MKTPTNSNMQRRQKRYLLAIIAAWLILVALPTAKPIRSALTWPLYQHHPDASGELAYVMADGYAYLERLRAAADLYHMHQVKQIYILNEQETAGYNFQLRRSQTKAEVAVAYLGFLGVPSDVINTVNASTSALFGSLTESQAMAAALPDGVGRVVVVTSAPHTRRSLLCFRRSLPTGIQSQVYSASEPIKSAELSGSIWLEYVKLIVYFVAA
ncbi:MAG: YdcF family protein [Pirellulaceae bacterium]